MTIPAITNNPAVQLQANGLYLERDTEQGAQMVHTAIALQLDDLLALDAIVRAGLGSRETYFNGVAASQDFIQLVWQGTATAADMLLGQAYCDQWGSLHLSVDNRRITCNDPKIATLSSLGYVFLYQGSPYAAGVADVTSGEATLVMPAECPAGNYACYVHQLAAPYANGKVELTL